MEPIISPWLIYLVGICGDLKGVSVVVIICTSIIGAVSGMAYHLEGGNSAKSLAKYCLVAIIIAGILFVSMPTSGTVYKMIAASYVTPDNVVVARDQTLELIGMIANAIGR